MHDEKTPRAAGILPVKSPSRAKSRLADSLGQEVTRQVADALFEDALALLASSPELDWWVVSDDEAVLERARRAGNKTAQDAGEGFNQAVAAAFPEVLASGAPGVLVIPCDLPLAWRGDLEDILDTGETSDVVVVPSGADGGTNALYLGPPDVLEPRFGPSSLQAHIAAAERARIRCSVLALPRLALDLDTIEDARELAGRPETPNDGHTVRLLREVLPAAP
jgi:2-phospho-L-lactate guanylyltransferase